MSQQTINVGAAPNDGTGTPLRTAFQYTNSNFSELYTALGGGSGLPGATTQVIFNDGGTNLAGDAGLVYNKTTDALTIGGNVQAASGTITGDLTVDTSTLKVDSTNNRVGINTASPGKPLEVYNTTESTLWANTTTGISLFRAGGTGGDFYFGIDNSTGGGFGQGNYSRLIYSTGAYPIIFSTNATSRMTLDSSGNLGLGVTPSAWAAGSKGFQFGAYGALAQSSSGNIELSFNSYNSGAGAYKYLQTDAASLYRASSVHTWFVAPSGTAGNAITFTQAMTLDASGNLLVGTTSQPSGVTYSRATIKSTSGDWSSVIWNSNATPYGLRIQHDTDSNGTGNEFLLCLGAANTRTTIRSNGGIANYQANDVNLSDGRTKTDIKPLGSYWNKIKSLEIVTFKYKDQTHSDDNIGLIAQQVESVAPELVDVDGFGKTPEDGVPLKTIYTTDLYHAAIKALQEAMARIEVLESKLA